MSQENVEIVRRMFEAFSRRDNDGPYKTFAPDIIWDVSRGSIGGTVVYHGHEGVRDHFRDVFGSFTNISFAVGELWDAGDRVLAAVDEGYRGRTSGVEVNRRHYALYTFRDGLIAEMRVYVDRTEALEAVGLSE